MTSPKLYAKVTAALIDSGARQAILYVSEKRTIKATRTRYRGKFSRRCIEITLTDGPPNYTERQRIKQLKKVKEPFPVKKVQLRISK